MTDLEKGILVYISKFELNSLKNKKGFIPFDAYPDEYLKIALPNEVGRFLFFRFIKLKDDKCLITK